MKTVFKDILIYDGTGKKPWTGSVAVEGNRISCVSQSCPTEDTDKVIDGRGLALSPGFIDFHSHADFILPSPNCIPYENAFLGQGITTFFGGNCGASPFPVEKKTQEFVKANTRGEQDDLFDFKWETMPQFCDYVKGKSVLNAGLLVGHGVLRSMIMGNDPSPMNESQKRQMKKVIAELRKQGCFGISFGLAFIPGVFATDDELLAVFEAVAENDMILTIHGHTYNYSSNLFDIDPKKLAHNVYDTKLFCDMAKKTGARTNLSHVLLKGDKTWGTCSQVLDTIDEAVAAGADVTFGVIPYHWGNTLINTIIPKWFLEDLPGNLKKPDALKRVREDIMNIEASIGRYADDLYVLWGNSENLKKYVGKNFEQIGKEIGEDYAGTIIHVLKESEGKAKLLTAAYSGKEFVNEEPLLRLMKHERSIIEVDAIVTSLGTDQVPAAFGAYPKFIGRYARDRKLMPMETAIHKITGKPAERMRISDRGTIEEGKIADLVVFDPKTILDTNTIAEPTKAPVGIHQVWMDGKLVLEDGERRNEDYRGSILLY